MWRWWRWSVQSVWLRIGVLGITFLLSLWMAGAFPYDPLVSVRLRVEDWRWHVVKKPVEAPIVIVDIDEASLANLGAWPWPRARFAELLRVLNDQYHVSLIGLDVLFPENSVNAAHDQLLAKQVRPSIVFAHAFDLRLQSTNQAHGLLYRGYACPPQMSWPKAKSHIGLYPAFKAVPQSGHISPLFDEDGTIRRAYPVIQYLDHCYPSLSYAMMLTMLGRNQDQSAIKFMSHNHAGLELDGVPPLPLLEDGSVIIPWRDQSFLKVSAVDVLNRRIPDEWLKKSVVLIGSTAAGFGDLVPTPLSSDYPGVMVHAQLLQAGIFGEWWREPDWAGSVAYIYAAAVLLCLYLFASRMAYWLALVAMSGVFVWCAVNLALFRQGIVLPLLPPILLIAGVMPAFLLVGNLKAWELRASLYRQFSAYLPEQVLQQLVRSGVDPRSLEAEQAEITILFADVKNFTHLAEGLLPAQVARLLQILMTELADIIAKHEGTLDKFMGDAVMAFWGAPLSCRDHADRGLSCAQAMLAALPRINDKLQQEGLPLISLGIGLNSGLAAVGNLGSTGRRAYSAVGDAVNLAARIEKMTGEFNEPLLLGEGVCRYLRVGALIPLGKINVRGKSKKIWVAKPL